MRYPLLITLALTLILQAATADEYTVEPKPFKIETALDAVFLPSDSKAIMIKPETSADFTITSLLAHGAGVKKGDTLIGIDTRTLDKEITNLEKSVVISQLKLAQTQHELEQLKITTPRSLEAHARSETEATEDWKHYTTAGQAIEIEQAKRSVEKAEFFLAAQKEELQQLLKMYGEDNKTEETEEIILKRARHYVDRAEFALKTTKIRAQRQLSTAIPRNLKSKQLAAQNARIANTDAKEKLPHALKIKQQETEKAAKDHQEKTEKLTKLKADRAMMDITAPVDGLIYYGEIKDGRWNPAAAAKALKIGGKIPANSCLMNIIPANTSLELHALASEKHLGTLDKESTGYATTELNRFQSFPVTISHIASHPNTDGTFLTTLKATLPENLAVVPGIKASVKIITNKLDQALIIPADYLTHTDDGGYSVNVKLADGKTAERKVTISKSNTDNVIVTEGLEKGQVIVK